MDLVSAMRLVQQRKAVAPPVWESAVVQTGPDDDGRVRINSAGIVESALCPISIDPAAGDVVAIVRATAPLIVGILIQADPSGGGINPAPPSGYPTSGTSYYPALYTKTWWYPDDIDAPGAGVLISNGIKFTGTDPKRKPYWFYQSQIRSDLTGATVDSARMRFPASGRADGWSGRLVFADVYATWPTPLATPANLNRKEPLAASGAPDPVSISTSSSAAEWVSIPAETAQVMTTAFIAIGAGIDSTDDPLDTRGLSGDPQSGLLEITWHR